MGGDVREPLPGEEGVLQPGTPASALPLAAAREEAGPNVQEVDGGQGMITSTDMDADKEPLFQSEASRLEGPSCSSCSFSLLLPKIE